MRRSGECSQILRQTTAVERATVKPAVPSEGARDWILGVRHLVREVLVARTVEDYVVRLVTATRPTDGADHDVASAWRGGGGADIRARI